MKLLFESRSYEEWQKLLPYFPKILLATMVSGPLNALLMFLIYPFIVYRKDIITMAVVTMFLSRVVVALIGVGSFYLFRNYLRNGFPLSMAIIDHMIDGYMQREMVKKMPGGDTPELRLYQNSFLRLLIVCMCHTLFWHTLIVFMIMT